MTHYQRSIVSYLDLLGFRAIIAANREPAWIADFLRLFTRASTKMRVIDLFRLSPSNPGGPLPTRAKTFSDLAVRVTPVPAEASVGFLVYDEAECVSWLQGQLVYKGVLLRGYVTVGDIYLDENVVFGPALVRAYELESELARFPRVIIDPVLYEDILRESAGSTSRTGSLGIHAVDGMLKFDADGMRFIDYFSRIIMHDLRHGDLAFAEAHRDLTAIGLKDTLEAASTLAKYKWVPRRLDCIVRKRLL